MILAPCVSICSGTVLLVPDALHVIDPRRGDGHGHPHQPLRPLLPTGFVHYEAKKKLSHDTGAVRVYLMRSE